MLTTLTEAGLLRLLQLCSANLPVGAYAFSQGLEAAVEDGWVRGPEDVAQWLRPQLQHGLARVDLPLLRRLSDALRRGDEAGARYWNDYLLACRESHELRLADSAGGEALRRLLPALDVPLLAELLPCSFLTAYAQAAVHWGIAPRAAAAAWLWAWLENQVIAVTKLLPLGQTRAQLLLGELQVDIPAALDLAEGLEDHELGAGLPALAIASARHETQYSRLFRS